MSLNVERFIAGGADPVELARALKVEPDDWQAKALRGTAQQSLWLCARQVGKTTAAAILALHTALYRPESTVLLISPSQRQSALAFRRVLAFYRSLGRPQIAEAENLMSLTLETGSQIVSLPGTESTVRGHTADLVVMDEAARIDDALYEATRPMLAVSGGRLIAMTTPAGPRGWFWEAWESGDVRWERVKVTADECPRISRAHLEQERAMMGDVAYRTEYLCEFGEMEGAAFLAADIEALFSDPTVKPLFAEDNAA